MITRLTADGDTDITDEVEADRKGAVAPFGELARPLILSTPRRAAGRRRSAAWPWASSQRRQRLFRDRLPHPRWDRDKTGPYINRDNDRSR